MCRAILEYAHRDEEILFLVSGDVVQSGYGKQYEKAMDFFLYIQDALKKQKNIQSHFIFAPGNHDAIINEEDLDEKNRRKIILSKKDSLEPKELQYYQEKMCEKQRNYFDFIRSFDEESIIKINTGTSLLEQYQINISKQDIFINVLNTSWISQIKEKPGEIYIPKVVYEQKIVKKNGLNITMYHHPSNWMHPDDKIYFDSAIRRQSDIIFVGHEHCGREEYILSRDVQFDIEYGEVLQDETYEYLSAFKIHYIEDGSICTRIYRWDNVREYYNGTELPPKKIGDNIDKTICFLPEYREKLNSIEMQISHPRMKKVYLSDLFIFPNIEAYNSKKSFEESTKEKVTVYGGNLLEYILENRFIEFSGGQKVGKSALARMISLNLEQIGVHAIILDCKKITNWSIKNVQKVEEYAIYEGYGKKDVHLYRQLLPHQKIIIFDNIDVIRDKTFKREMMMYFSNFYNYIVSFTNMSYELAMVGETIHQETELEFKHCTIKELGYKQRNRLYKKWYLLGEGDGNYIVEEELEKKVKEATNTINTLKGNGYMPCIPPNIIIILQQLEFQSERNESRSNYGYMYQFLIDKSMLDMKKHYDSISVDIASGILTWVARYMLENRHRSIDIVKFGDIVQIYNKKHITDASKDIYLDGYTNVDLIEVENEQIRFKYPYIHYYFTAKYLAENISDDEVKGIIGDMAYNLQDEECGDIMIFLCHLTKVPFVFECVLKSSKALLTESQVFDFNEYKDIKMTFEEHLDTGFLPEEGKEERQERMLERQDKYEEETESANIIDDSDEEYDDAELQQKIEVLDAAYKSIEVMGQILKNYPGTIDGKIKVELLQETHTLGMRSLTYSYDMIKCEIEKILERICQKIGEQLNKQNVAIDDKIIKKYIEEESSVLKEQTDNLFGLMCYTLLRRLSNAVGNEDLKPLINHLEADDVISYQIMKKSIYLNEFGIIQGDVIISFYDMLVRTGNIFAAKILKLFVYEHYYVFGAKDINMRKRIWSKLGFNKKQEDVLLLTQQEIK